MNARTRLLTPQAVDVGALDGATRDAMYVLYARHYDAASRARFFADLADKRYAVLLHDETGVLQGFSTLAVYEREFEGERVGILFSGDTVVDARHWGQQALAFAWLRLAGEIKARTPRRPLYWFLISKGHRTYRFLTAFSREFWPAQDRVTPPRIKALMDALARDRFGADYDAASGVIRFAQSHGHLREPFAEVSAAHRQRPEVAFFLARNPGYARGEELVCLCELAAETLQPLARRVFCGESMDAVA
jgi:hypothetical protein